MPSFCALPWVCQTPRICSFDGLFGYRGLSIGITAEPCMPLSVRQSPLWSLDWWRKTFQPCKLPWCLQAVSFMIDETSYEPLQKMGKPKSRRQYSFEHVFFIWWKHPILDDISFSVNRRNHCLCRSYRFWKSSIINVLMRFYEFQSGRVLLDELWILETTVRKSWKERRSSLGIPSSIMEHPSNIICQDLSDEEEFRLRPLWMQFLYSGPSFEVMNSLFRAWFEWSGARDWTRTRCA